MFVSNIIGTLAVYLIPWPEWGYFVHLCGVGQVVGGLCEGGGHFPPVLWYTKT